MVDFFCFLLYNLDGDYMNNNKIYNVVFPIWFFIIIPLGWLFVLPINFLIDSLVLLIILKLMKMPLKKKPTVKHGVYGLYLHFFCPRTTGATQQAVHTLHPTILFFLYFAGFLFSPERFFSVWRVELPTSTDMIW